MAQNPSNVYLARRPLVLGLAKLVLLSLTQLPLVHAAPISISSIFSTEKEKAQPAGGPGLWLYLGFASALVLLGGAFAGLTIALMGQVRLTRSLLQSITQANTAPRTRCI
jgi:metal transporter CNNM